MVGVAIPESIFIESAPELIGENKIVSARFLLNMIDSYSSS